MSDTVDCKDCERQPYLSKVYFNTPTPYKYKCDNSNCVDFAALDFHRPFAATTEEAAELWNKDNKKEQTDET